MEEIVESGDRYDNKLVVTAKQVGGRAMESSVTGRISNLKVGLGGEMKKLSL